LSPNTTQVVTNDGSDEDEKKYVNIIDVSIMIETIGERHISIARIDNLDQYQSLR
jgi:hypothetical protein